MEKAGTQAVEPRIRAGKPGTLAVEQWLWMVNPWARAVQSNFGRAARSGCNGGASGEMGKPVVEPGSPVVEQGAQPMKTGARAIDQGVRWLKIGSQAGKLRTPAVESGPQTVVLAASGAQAVESVALTVNRTS